MCACVFQLPRLRGNAGTQGSTCGRLKMIEHRKDKDDGCLDNTLKNVNNVLIENVQGYVYLGQHYSLKEKNQYKEIQRRIMAGWAAYAKHLPEETGVQLLSAMTYYGAETWTLTKQAQNKLVAAQTRMERSMLNT